MSNEDLDRLADRITSPWHDRVDQLADAATRPLDATDRNGSPGTLGDAVMRYASNTGPLSPVGTLFRLTLVGASGRRDV